MIAGIDRGNSPLLPRSAPRQFHLLAKPTGAVCNLDCTYCFFLSKELLYPGSRFRMADDLLEAYLRQLIEAQAGAPEVVVAWQGGEPTMMGLDFFRRSVELADGMKRPGQRIAYTIQTNGTLLDEDWAAFFKEHGFLVEKTHQHMGQHLGTVGEGHHQEGSSVKRKADMLCSFSRTVGFTFYRGMGQLAMPSETARRRVSLPAEHRSNCLRT